MALVTWNAIDGVPVHYARDKNPPLRNEGRQLSFRSTQAFKDKLDAMFAELWQHCGLGKADIITTAGAFVQKPGKHGSGEAFDLDGIVWRSTDSRPERKWWAIDFDTDAQFYWGVGGILNRHMKFVLHAKFNADHRDHYHVDNSFPPGFSPNVKSVVKYLQAALTHIHAVPTVIDGVFGRNTKEATRIVLERLSLPNDITSTNVWLPFNLETAQLGMGFTAPAPSDDPDRNIAEFEPSLDLAPMFDHERVLTS